MHSENTSSLCHFVHIFNTHQSHFYSSYKTQRLKDYINSVLLFRTYFRVHSIFKYEILKCDRSYRPSATGVCNTNVSMLTPSTKFAHEFLVVHSNWKICLSLSEALICIWKGISCMYSFLFISVFLFLFFCFISFYGKNKVK